jgi:hypothetical protein
MRSKDRRWAWRWQWALPGQCLSLEHSGQKPNEYGDAQVERVCSR